MNVLTTTWRQLVRRRLWPVALLLVVALAAVPVLLSRDAAPVESPDAGAAALGAPAKVEDSLSKPVVAKASSEDRSRRRRVLGARKNPFQPAPVKKPKTKKPATKPAAKEKPSSDSKSGGTPAPPSGGSTPVAPTPTVTPTPAPKKTYAKGSLIVRFGDATGDLTRLNLKKLAPLPDDENPLLVYMGLTAKGKKAVFLVDASLAPTGDGKCKPHPATCEKIELAKGETEFFDVLDEDGNVTAQYQLDLVDIK